jgi:hypothetical protein
MTARQIDTTRMIASFDSISKKNGQSARHYVALGFRAVQACDGRSISAVSVSATDERYKTCVRCAKLAASQTGETLAST